jgi:WD40 repeat protein
VTLESTDTNAAPQMIHFMVMEYLVGESLKERLDRLHQEGEPPSLAQELDLFRSISEAVEYAHQAGVVHRDLKPANVMFNAHHQPILTDFGLAALVNSERPADESIVGTPLYMAPEQSAGDPGDVRSDIYALGVMLYELTTGAPPFSGDSAIDIILKHLEEPLPPPRALNPDLPPALERIIQHALEKEPAHRYPSVRAMLADLAELELEQAAGAPPPDPRCPYRGLRAFHEEHADFYFGREALTGKLLETVTALVTETEPGTSRPHPQFLAVIGASGSGKSSLVRAGLLPSLRQASLPGGVAWDIRVIKPGAAPLQELTAGLISVGSDEPAPEITAQLAADGRALHRLKPLAAERRLMLVVDQFEELFTLCQSEDEGRQFVLNLLYATTVPDPWVFVIITMRADFYHRCTAYPELVRRISSQQLLVGPLNENQLRRAIEQPAHRVGLKFEPDLVNVILDDVDQQPGALPLLQHALLELWERREAGRLTGQAYRASGGVTGAVSQRADALYNNLTPIQQSVLRRIMLRLTRPGEGTEDTRRRVHKAELFPGAEQPATAEDIETVLQQLIEARLVRASHDPASGDEVVDVAHEALIRGWGRLRGWLDDDRAALHTHHHLTQTTNEWRRNQDDASYLYQGTRLAQAVEWAQNYAANLNQAEMAFLHASQAAAEAVAQEKEAARRRELTQAQTLAEAEHQRAETQARARRRLRWLALGLTAIMVVAVALGLLARQAQQQAEDAAAVAQSLNLSTSAQLALNQNNTDLALVLALEANKIDNPPPQARLTLAEIAYAPGTHRLFTGHQGPVQGVVISPNGQTALSASADQTLRLWDLESGKTLRTFSGHTAAVNSVAISPNGQTALSASADQTLRLWDIETGQPVRTFSGHTAAVNSVAISPDGQSALSASADQTLRLWDIETGQPVRTFSGHTTAVNSVAISPDGQSALSGSANGDVILWDMTTGQIRYRLAGIESTAASVTAANGHAGPVWSVAYSADGLTAFSGSEDELITRWDLSGAEIGLQRIKVQPASGIFSLAVSPDGRTLLSGLIDSRVASLNATTGQTLQPYLGHSGRVLALAYHPDGRMALSGAADGTLRLWDLEHGALQRRLAQDSSTISGFINLAAASIALSPDGQLGATGHWNGDISLWDYPTGQVIRTLTGHTDMVFGGVLFSPDGETLFSGAGDIFARATDNTIRVWDVASGQEDQRLEGHTDKLWDIDVSADGRFVVSGSHDGTARLWDLQTGDSRVLLDVFPQSVRSVALSPDGQLILAGLGQGGSSNPNYDLRLIDVESGQELRRFTSHNEVVGDVAFDPTGEMALSGAGDTHVILWDVATGKEIRRFTGHNGTVLAVAFSSDGTLVASSSQNRTAIVWNTATGNQLRRFPGHGGSVVDLVFTPPGQSLLTAAAEDGLREWRIDQDQTALQDWIATNRYLAELTCEQREQYNITPLCEAPP